MAVDNTYYMEKGIILPASVLHSWHWVLLFWQLTVECHSAPAAEKGDEECQAKNIYESIRYMTKTITISQLGIIFTQLNKACHIGGWKHQNSVCQQSFHGVRLLCVWQVHWQELFQLAACNSKQFCSCLSGVFLTIHKYTQHTGFPTCARSLLLYDILARSRVIRFPIVFALLPLRKRRSLHENIGSLNTFDVYYD